MVVKKVKIYTKGGDRGQTSLFGGKRISKDSPRIETIGTIDELNAALGVAETSIKDKGVKKIIHVVQNELFNIGAYFADPASLTQKTKRLAGFSSKKISILEGWIDDVDTRLAPLRTFILPGGSAAGAQLHFARSVCRRAEREVVKLARKAKIAPNIQIYLNRLSDLLFVLARYENKKSGKKETSWQKT